MESPCSGSPRSAVGGGRRLQRPSPGPDPELGPRAIDLLHARRLGHAGFGLCSVVSGH